MAGEAMSAFVRFFVKDEVSADAKKVEKNAKKAADGMEDAATKAKNDFANGLETARGAAAKAAKGFAALAGAAGAMVAGAFALAGEESQNYTQNMNMLATSAETVGVSQEEANKAYQNFLGLTGDSDQATEAAQDMLNLAQAGGDIDTWYNIAAGTVARFGDALPVENLIESANETIRTGKIVGSMADAVNWATATTEQWEAALGGNQAALDAFNAATAEGMSAEDAFNEALAACTSESERAQITQAALNQIYGETGQAFKETNADVIAQRQAQDEFNAAMARAGEVVRPFVTAVTQLGAELIERLLPYVESIAASFSENFIPALENLANAVLPPIMAAFQWLVDNLPWIAPLVVGIAAAFVSYPAIAAAITAVKSAMALLRSGTLLQVAAQAALNLVMSLNPFAIVVAAIMGLVAAFVYLWNTSDGFRNAVIGTWEKIKSVAISVFDTVGSTISGAMETARSVVDGAIEFIKGCLDFSWEWPSVPLPHFSFSGSINPLDWPSKGLPSVGVEWYAKGGIFDKPTLFSTPQGLAGIGEKGAEAAAPVSVLLDYFRQAAQEIGGGGYVANINVTTGETSEEKLAKLIAREQKRNAYALGAI